MREVNNIESEQKGRKKKKEREGKKIREIMKLPCSQVSIMASTISPPSVATNPVKQVILEPPTVQR